MDTGCSLEDLQEAMIIEMCGEGESGKSMLEAWHHYDIYIYIYIYKQDLLLNDLQGLICHKTNQPTNQPFPFSSISPLLLPPPPLPLFFFFFPEKNFKFCSSEIWFWRVFDWTKLMKKSFFFWLVHTRTTWWFHQCWCPAVNSKGL